MQFDIKRYASFSYFLILLISKFQIMKKIYIQPTMLAVTMQHQSHILEISINEATGPGGTSYGGGSDGEAHTKENKSIWDDEW